MKVKVQIFKGKRWDGTFVEGQLIVVMGNAVIIPIDNHLQNLPWDNCLEWDGHHLRQGVDTPLWVDADSIELVGETEIEIG